MGCVYCSKEYVAGVWHHKACLLSLYPCSDSFIMEYCGEVCTTEEFVRRKKEYHKERRRHYYFMSLKSDEVSMIAVLQCTQGLFHWSDVHTQVYTHTHRHFIYGQCLHSDNKQTQRTWAVRYEPRSMQIS